MTVHPLAVAIDLVHVAAPVDPVMFTVLDTTFGKAVNIASIAVLERLVYDKFSVCVILEYANVLDE